MPTAKTAYLVIHGMGEQAPFETLDQFTRGLTAAMQKASGSGLPPELSHQLLKRDDWEQSYLAVKQDGVAVADVYEFYWAYLTVQQAQLSDVATWLTAVIKGAATYRGLAPQQVWSRVLKFGFVDATLVRLVVAGLHRAESLLRWVLPGFPDLLIDYLGDVAAYCAPDERSPHFAVRQKIISAGSDLLLTLLRQPQYERIIIVGHSLGSVIAYDLLARVNRRINVEPDLLVLAPKLQGLVTLGSPLDKTAFFYQQQGDGQDIRSAINTQLYGFRRKLPEAEPVHSDIGNQLGALRWVNFFNTLDPVSSALEVYSDVLNVDLPSALEHRAWSRLGRAWESHLAYWQSQAMYAQILQLFPLQ